MKKLGMLFAALVLAALAMAGVAFFEGFVLMILLGILWGEFQWLAPIGIFAAVGLVTFGELVLGWTACSLHGETFSKRASGWLTLLRGTVEE